MKVLRFSRSRLAGSERPLNTIIHELFRRNAEFFSGVSWSVFADLEDEARELVYLALTDDTKLPDVSNVLARGLDAPCFTHDTVDESGLSARCKRHLSIFRQNHHAAILCRNKNRER